MDRGKALVDGFEDSLRRNRAKAFERLEVAAPLAEARLTRKRRLQDMICLPVRAGTTGFGRTKQSDDRLVESGGDVHRAGVITHHEIG